MAHKALNAILAAVPGVTHASAHDRLQVEGQSLFRPARHVVQMEAHGPQELPGTPSVARFLLGQNAIEIGQFTHGPGIEDISGDPVKRLEIPQPAAAFLDIRLHDKRAVAVAAVANRTLSLLGRDIFGRPGFLAGCAKAAIKLGEKRFVTGQEPRIKQRRPDRCVLGALSQAIADGAGGMTNLEAEIPQKIQHILDHAQRVGFRVFGGQKKQIDIAEWRQDPAAETCRSPLCSGARPGQAPRCASCAQTMPRRRHRPAPPTAGRLEAR